MSGRVRLLTLHLLKICLEFYFQMELSKDLVPADGDGVVNFLDWTLLADAWQDTTDANDLAAFAEQWLQPGLSYLNADIAPIGAADGTVDMLDFATLAKNWLETP